MGCGFSKNTRGIVTVDDSVHVMIKHDKEVARRKGQESQGYVPRAPHVLPEQQQQQTEDKNTASATGKKDDEMIAATATENNNNDGRR